MAEPATLDDFAAGDYPPDGSPGPLQSTFRLFVGPVAQRVRKIPATSVGYEGHLLAGRQDGAGFDAAGNTGAAVLTTNGLPLVGNEAALVAVTGNDGFRHKDHLGRVLEYAGSGAITLTMNLDTTGAAGVKDRFHCVILRAVGAGAVHVVLASGLVLQRTDGLLGVAQGVPVGILLSGTRVYLTGGVIA